MGGRGCWVRAVASDDAMNTEHPHPITNYFSRIIIRFPPSQKQHKHSGRESESRPDFSNWKIAFLNFPGRPDLSDSSATFGSPGDFAAALFTLLEPLLLRVRSFEEVDAVCALAARRVIATRDLIEYFQLHIAHQAAASQ